MRGMDYKAVEHRYVENSWLSFRARDDERRKAQRGGKCLERVTLAETLLGWLCR